MASFCRTGVLTLALIVVETLSLPVRAAQLPPPILLDRELVRLERLVSEGSYYQALGVLDEIRTLQQEHPDLVLPEDLSYRYAEIAMELGLVQEAIDSVHEYLLATGQSGELYRSALRLLDAAEAELSEQEAAERLAEAERERAVRRQREREELIQRQLDAAAVPPIQDPLQSGGLGPGMVRVAGGTFVYHRQCYGCGSDMWVDVDTSFAISRYEVTRKDFEQFVKQTRYRTEAESEPKYGCNAFNFSIQTERNGYRWNRHPHNTSDNHPVVCVSIRDAVAYTAWLSAETGHTYRLPSPAESEFAARAGDPQLMPIITTAGREALEYEALCAARKIWCPNREYNENEREWLKPVGQFTPNRIGLYDMFGNAGELLMACSHTDNGEAQHPDTCRPSALIRVIGGREPYNLPHTSQSEPFRGRTRTYYNKSSIILTGFRVVRELN